MIFKNNKKKQQEINTEMRVRFGITYKLATLVAVAGFLPLFAAGIYMFLSVSSFSKDEIHEKMQISVDIANKSISDYYADLGGHLIVFKSNFTGSKEIVEMLHSIPSQEGTLSPKTKLGVRNALREYLVSVVDKDAHTAGVFTNIYIFDAIGEKLIVSTNTDISQGSQTYMDLYKNTRSHARSIRSNDETFLLYNEGGDDDQVVTVVTPLFTENGSTQLFLAGDVPMREFTKPFLSTVFFQTHTELYFISQNGQVLAEEHVHDTEDHENIREVGATFELWERGSPLVGDSGLVEYINHNAVNVLGGYTWSPTLNLWILVEVEKRDVYAFLDKITNLIAIWLAFLLGIGVIIYFLISFLVVSPLKRLTDFVTHIDIKNKSNILPLFTISTHDEIGVLAGAFNRMLVRIYEAQFDLEKKVIEKTHDLAASLETTERQNKFLEDSKRATMNVLEDAWELKEKFKLQRNELQSIITSIGEGLFLVNQEHVITLANPMTEQILDIPLKDIIGKKVDDVILARKNGKDIPYDDRLMARVLATKLPIEVGLEDHYSFRTNSGKEFPVAVFATPLVKDKDMGAVIVFRDISKEKALDESKSSFISIASHQLRTPLTSIRWYSEMLLSEDAGPLNEMQRDFASEVNSGTLRLYNTIDLLLSISRIENGTLKQSTEKVNIVKLMNEVIEEFKPQLSPKALTMNVSLPQGDISDIDLDPLLLRQVFLNLIANSIQYTNNGGIINVSIEKREGEYLCRVQDNGIGIPDEEKSRIFSKFYRAQNASNKVPDGSGLGLSLVKGLIESWGGKVWFDSEIGKGTTFNVTVPEHPSLTQKMS